MTRATIRDVAKEAGVSVATVSRALRGLPSVAPATKARVLAVAEALDYVPDPYASRLGTTAGHTVSVVVPLPGQWYYAQVVTGAEAVLSEAGYDMTLQVVGDQRQRAHFVGDVLPSLRRVDGTIIVDVPFTSEQVSAIASLGSTVVAVGEHLNGLPAVSIDNEGAGYEATAALIAGGHTRIGLVGGMRDPHGEGTIPGKRTRGFRRAHSDAGLDLDDSLIMSGNFSVGGGIDAGRALLGRADRPDAIFALSDEMAIGVISAARELAISIPGDLCLLGFDDHDLSAALGLSTVHQPVVEAGEAAAQLLLDIFAGAPGDEVTLPYDLRLRGTTDCAL